MICKIKNIINQEETEVAERCGYNIPEEIISWDNFWFNEDEIKRAYITSNNNINIVFDDEYYTVEKTDKMIYFLNKKFK